MSVSRTGHLIALEGIDGSGKTSLASRLAAALERRGHRTLVTREPGGTSLGRTLRDLLLHTSPGPQPTTELLLYAADRAEHVHTVIRPALERGAIVLSDRYQGSTLAYQGGGRGHPRATLDALHRIATGGLQPNLTLYLRIPPQTALARTNHRQRDRMEHTSLLERAHRAYDAIALHDPTWETLDATQPLELLERQALERTLWSLSEAKARARALGSAHAGAPAIAAHLR